MPATVDWTSGPYPWHQHHSVSNFFLGHPAHHFSNILVNITNHTNHENPKKQHHDKYCEWQLQQQRQLNKKPTLCIKSNNKNNKHKELEIPLKNAKTNLQFFNTPESCQGEQHGRRTQIWNGRSCDSCDRYKSNI